MSQREINVARFQRELLAFVAFVNEFSHTRWYKPCDGKTIALYFFNNFSQYCNLPTCFSYLYVLLIINWDMKNTIDLNSLLLNLQEQAQNGNLEDSQIEILIEFVKSAHDKDINKWDSLTEKEMKNLKRHYKDAWDAMAEYTKLYSK